MKHLLVAILLLSCSGFSYGQTDSLKAELQKHPDNLKLKYQLGMASLKNGKADSAAIWFNDVIRIAGKTGDTENYILAKIQAGRLLADKGENVKALKLYEEALSKAESINSKLEIAHIYKNIGALYISWKKFDNALNYYEKAEALAAEIGDNVLVADCQNNKGTVYEQTGAYDQAIKAYKNALAVYSAKNIKAKVAMALSNIAIVYKYQKNYKASLEYNKKALAISVNTGDKWMMSATYNNIGNLYGEMGDYKNAIAYCEKALAIAKQIDAIEIEESIYDSMSEAAAKAGDYKNAYQYHKEFSAANRKFINIESANQLSELNVKFETERRQKLIQEQQFEISKRNYWLYGALMLLVLIAIVAYLVIRNNTYKQDKRIQAEIRKQQEIETRSLFEGEQKERIRIARDLHDSIGQLLSVVKMNLSFLGHQFKGDDLLENTITLLDKTITEVRHISHNLIPEELNFGLFAALEDMAEKISESGTTKVLMDIPDEVRAHRFERSNELSIYRIVQEALGNIVKHAQATRVQFSVLQQAGGITILIKDDGKGFDTAQIKTSGGIGWKNIAARVNMLNGHLQVRSEKLKGTQIEITIPG
nr:sensor histidine kinase [uncultured Mucilaginibacter sp.]